MVDTKYYRFMRAINAFSSDNCDSCPIKKKCDESITTIGSCEQLLFYYVEFDGFPPKDFFKNISRNY